jgi:hypothetical protein
MILYIVVVVVLLAGAFYGGMKYEQGAGLKNLSTAQRQQLLAGMRGANGQGARGGAGASGNRPGGGFANGLIISQTDTSITVKLRDGSSKIVLLAASTKINKSVAGQKSDLAINSQVTVSGTANSDGTITADTVTLNPLLPTPTTPPAPNTPAPVK